MLSLSLGNCHGQLLIPPVISQSCSAINISAQNEIIVKMLTKASIVRPCSCGIPEWTRAVYLNMSDPSQSCPSNLTLVSSPIRGCRRKNLGLRMCDSVYYSVGGTYSRICGRIIAYQKGIAAGFVQAAHNSRGIDGAYLDGVSLTHGVPGSRQHIWSFVGTLYDQDPYYYDAVHNCPCTNTAVPWPYHEIIPSFINNSYFCDTGNPGPGHNFTRYYTDDPLWDGQGCGVNSTCCEFNTPPWFCTSLPQPTNDNLELRNCYADGSSVEDKIITLIEIYVK